MDEQYGKSSNVPVFDDRKFTPVTRSTASYIGQAMARQVSCF
jgi:hypothetical protein